MEFDPNSMNFGAAQTLSRRAEPAHIELLSRQAEQSPQTKPEHIQVVKKLKDKVVQHEKQARTERLKQMQQALTTEVTPHRLMQALALVRKIYSEDHAPSDLATMSLLQPILQGLLPKWKSLKTGDTDSPITPQDYQLIQKLRQPHATLPTPERAVLYKLLHMVYQAMENQTDDSVFAPPVAAAPPNLMALKSRLLRATSDVEKQRLQNDIQRVENAKKQDYHQQCLKALEHHQTQLKAIESLQKTPRPHLLQALSKLEQQWDKNRAPAAQHPRVPTVIQLASRQLARLGIADAETFIKEQRQKMQHEIQNLTTEEVLSVLQSWHTHFDEALTRFQEQATALVRTKALSKARANLHILKSKLDQWPTQLEEVKSLENKLLELKDDQQRADVRNQLFKRYSDILSALPVIETPTKGETP